METALEGQIPSIYRDIFQFLDEKDKDYIISEEIQNEIISE